MANIVNSDNKTMADIVNSDHTQPTQQPTQQQQQQQSKKIIYCWCRDCNSVSEVDLFVGCDQCKENAVLQIKENNNNDNNNNNNNNKEQDYKDQKCRCEAGQTDKKQLQNYMNCINKDKHPNQNKNNNNKKIIPIPPASLTLLPELTNNNITNDKCAYCFEIAPLFVTFNKCDHKLCYDLKDPDSSCFVRYGRSHLNDKNGFIFNKEDGYVLPCDITKKCTQSFSVLKRPTLFKLLGKQSYEKYQSFGTDLFIETDNNQKVTCPFVESCKGAQFFLDQTVIHPSRNIQSIKCPSCQGSICILCYKKVHTGQKCDKDSKENKETEKFIALQTQKCPKCKSSIEKNGGCNHMTCQKCKFEFCWIDLKPWNNDCKGAHQFTA